MFVVVISIGLWVGYHLLVQDELKFRAEQGKRAEVQRQFEMTPEGKKAKEGREKAERESKVDEEKAQRQGEGEQLARYLFAHSCEQTLLDSGFDVTCVANKRHLVITGERVNRVFAHHFLQGRGVTKKLGQLGFDTISFWNGHSFTGIYTEDYAITH